MAKKKTTSKKSSHGGARQGAGRPPLPADQARRKRTVWLTDAEAEFAAAQGDSLSDGVQRVIAAAMGKSST